MHTGLKHIALILWILFVSLTNASENWRTHLMYASVTQIAESPTKVFGLSDGALFAYDKSSNITTVYSKTNGLNDNKVSRISYSANNELLIVIYDNANIDLIDKYGKIYNIPDIKNEPQALNKSITKINTFSNTAYLSTPFGLIALDLQNKTIKNCYSINKSVNAIIEYNQNLYAATPSGVYVSSPNTNQSDPNSWILYNNLVCSDLEVFDNGIVGLNSNGGLYKLSGSTSELKIGSSSFLRMKKYNNQLCLSTTNEIKIISDWDHITNLNGENISDFSTNSINESIWTANLFTGINKYEFQNNIYTFRNLTIKPKGPIANSPYQMKFDHNRLTVVGGGAWGDRYNSPAFLFFFENDEWSNISTDTIVAQGGKARDFTDFAMDPNNRDHIYVTSYGEGMYEFLDKKLVKIHDHQNSGIETVSFLKGINNYDRVYGICFDKNKNLFIANMLVNNSIKVLTNSNNWVALNYSSISNKNSIFNLLSTDSGTIVGLCNRSGTSIFFIDTNNTIQDQSDDRFKLYSTLTFKDQSNVLSATPDNFHTICLDNKNTLWIGTNLGIFYASNVSNVFNNDFSFIRPKAINSIGNLDYLLNNERVLTIAVDASNRKWLGTETNGLFLVNEDGTKIIKHFTYENSPLLSNKILSIAIHPTTGEVFIGTDKGLISYTNDALESKKSFSEVYAYPNPVKPEFEGDITITGLKAGADIRILNSGGNTVFEGKCETDEIVWSGKDSNNNRVDTGVYTVYAAVPGSLESMVTRIFIIK